MGLTESIYRVLGGRGPSPGPRAFTPLDAFAAGMLAVPAAAVLQPPLMAAWATASLRLSVMFAVRFPRLVEAGTAIAAAEAGISTVKWHPSHLRFSQDSISARFKDGGTLQAVIEGLKNRDIAPESFPPIRLFQWEGHLFTLDNRRLYVFQQAGMPIHTLTLPARQFFPELWKFRTQNMGVSIRVRGSRQ
jgi:hypothetical protein